MCGITGYVYNDKEKPASRAILNRMTETLVHRGPDGEGFYVHKNVALGHRRLSIIDLETGDQPIYNEDKKIVIVFNGEIYNYAELRQELKVCGHVFYTNTDTEVIVHAYEEWGIECQNRLNGMWAFAIWDGRRDRLFLSRDRIGEKPLYYSASKEALIFGSEIKSILAHGMKAEPALELTEIYLCLGYIPAPFTFYKNISKLLPGHCILWKNGDIKDLKYWDLPEFDEKDMITDRKYVYDQFERLLVDSVRLRMRSDVPFGAFLSGGLDSSSITALMSEISNLPVETFTIGFDDPHFDERKLARDVATQFKTNHHEHMVVSEEFDDALREVRFHADEPFGDASAIATAHVSRYAREKVKMVLTGDGGDEVLSGYESYQGVKFCQQIQRIPSVVRGASTHLLPIVARLFTGPVRYQLNRAKNVLETSCLPFNTRMVNKLPFIDLQTIKALIVDRHEMLSIEDFIEEFMNKCGYEDDFYKLMYLNLKLSLPDDMLCKVDRMSMAYSLETRTPFLDYRLIELMVKVDKGIKMEGYERKSVLRRTVGRRLPPALLRASKKGFSVPLREWVKDTTLESRLYDLYREDFGLNSSLIKAVIDDNLNGKSDNGDFIWALFVLKEWLGKMI